MSTIDSGLGWSCDSDYYTATARQALWSGGYTKANATPAVGGVLKYGNIYVPNKAGVLMSTDRNALTLNWAGQTVDIYAGTYTDSDGIVWNVGWMNNSQTVTGGLPLIGTQFNVPNFASFTATNVAEFIIRNANVQPTAKKIPTTDYVKAFVEGVEAETAERVNAAYDMIAPAFSTSENYSVGDIVIYNSKLYECISAHSAGAWVSADFSETSLAELIKERRK